MNLIIWSQSRWGEGDGVVPSIANFLKCPIHLCDDLNGLSLSSVMLQSCLFYSEYPLNLSTFETMIVLLDIQKETDVRRDGLSRCLRQDRDLFSFNLILEHLVNRKTLKVEVEAEIQ